MAHITAHAIERFKQRALSGKDKWTCRGTVHDAWKAGLEVPELLAALIFNRGGKRKEGPRRYRWVPDENVVIVWQLTNRGDVALITTLPLNAGQRTALSRNIKRD